MTMQIYKKNPFKQEKRTKKIGRKISPDFLFVMSLLCLNNQIVRDAPEGDGIQDIEDGSLLAFLYFI